MHIEKVKRCKRVWLEIIQSLTGFIIGFTTGYFVFVKNREDSPPTFVIKECKLPNGRDHIFVELPRPSSNGGHEKTLRKLVRAIKKDGKVFLTYKNNEVL
jgi:hypothetical protein